MLATANENNPVLAEAARAEVPVVLMDRLAPGHRGSSVSVDNEQGMRMAVAHLAALGHTRIAHIACLQQVSTGEGRRRGFLEGMKACGLAVDSDLIVTATGFTMEEGTRSAVSCRPAARGAPPWRSGTTCWRWAATRRWTRWACAARTTCRSSGSTTCPSSTGSGRR